MKIAIVIGFYHSGMQYLENVLAEKLSQANKLVVLTSNRALPGISYEEACRFDRASGFTIKRVKAAFRIRNIVVARSLRNELINWEPDLLIVLGVGQGFPLNIMSYVLRRKAVMICFFSDAFAQYRVTPGPLRWFKRVLFYLTKGWMYKLFVDHAVASFGVIQDSLRIVNPIVRRKLTLKPLPFDEQLFFRDERVGGCLRVELGLGENEPLFLVVGRLVREKAFDIVIDAFLSLPQTTRGMLVFVGVREGDGSPELRKRAEGQNGIRFFSMQRVERLNAFLNMADVGIWPIQPGITIQQALATGLYTILPEGEYFRMLTSKCDGEFLVKPVVNELCIAMKNAIENIRQLRMERSERASNNQWLSAENFCSALIAAVEAGESRKP